MLATRKACLSLALLAVLLLPFARCVRASSDDATSYLNNPTHNAVSSTPKLGTPLIKLWATDLGGNVSYPLIAQGIVFATSIGNGNNGTNLFGLNAQTGAIVWGPVSLGGTGSFGACAYENGKIFAVNFNGLLRSFDAATGAPDWSVQLQGQYFFTAAPTALNGVVYVGGAESGGTLYAVDETSGAVLWTQSVANGDTSSPVVTDDGVYVAYAGPQVYKFDPSGYLLWNYDSGLEGGGGVTSVLYNNQLYVPEFSYYNGGYVDGLVLDSDTGDFIKTIGSGYDNIPLPPAFDNGLGIFVDRYGNVQAQDIQSGAILWSFANGQDKIITAPLIINGNIYVGTGGGDLFALNEATGHAIWGTNVGGGITGFSEGNASTPAAMAAGESLLVIPVGHLLVAYSAAATTPIPATLSLSPSPTYAYSPVTATLTLSAAPTANLTVSLSVSNTNFATVPPTVTVAAGQTTATFPVTLAAGPATANHHLTVNATANGLTLSAPLEIQKSVWTAVADAVGPDGLTRMLWDNTDGRTAVWTLDASGNVASSPLFQPGSGWSAKDISVDTQGNAHILWTNIDGRMTVWTVSAQGSVKSLPIYQPGGGWAARGLSMDSAGNAHVLWFNPDGRMTVWTITPQGAATSVPVFQPGSGWMARSLSVDAQGQTHVLWFNTDGRMAVWTITPSGTARSTPIYQPGGDWQARKVSMDSAGNAHVLWFNTDGRMAVWSIDSSSNVKSTPIYQPGTGWSATGLAVDGAGSNRVLWDNVDGRTAVWTITADSGVTSTPIYQP